MAAYADLILKAEMLLGLLLVLNVSMTSSTYIMALKPRQNSPPPDVAANSVNAVDVAGDSQRLVSVNGAVAKETSKRRTAFFNDDLEIRRFLKSNGKQIMIWRCRNVIQHFMYEDQNSLPYFDLYCDVIGTVYSFTWYYRGKVIAGNVGQLSHNHRRRHHPSVTADAAGQSTSSKAVEHQLTPTSTSRYRHTIATHSDGGTYYLAWVDFRLRVYNATRRDSGMYKFVVTGADGNLEHHSIFVDISTMTSPKRLPWYRRWSSTALNDVVGHADNEEKHSNSVKRRRRRHHRTAKRRER